MLRLSDPEILAALERTAAALADGKSLIEALKPPPGPYALFHHRTHARERCLDVALILRRLLDGRARLTIANAPTEQLRPDRWPAGVPYPPEMQAAMQDTLMLGHALKLDFESLFHFGSVLMDQWAHMAGYLCGVAAPEQFTFHNATLALDREDTAGLRQVRAQLVRHARWLWLWMRIYRNKFVVHTNRPWQRGTIADSIGDEFSLHSPSPPGWENDGQLSLELSGLLEFAPDWLRNADPTYWERANPNALLQRVIENIGSVEAQADRDRIANLVARAGVETPTFQVVASVLSDFVSGQLNSLTPPHWRRPRPLSSGGPDPIP
jgi:hypothetical protein